MSYKETDIVYENGNAWVLRDAKMGRYTVLTVVVTHSTSDSAYQLDDAGLSIAKARADYLYNRIKP